ncbi:MULTISPECIES: alginate O-acetyltransferase AlgF [unclassified Pseudomonas]|uniref:alginate O-acetyltransferase AlgF n=1 Tax=unclassified Pseudomonas TaxID=196821 RepID=UPI002449C012|nr:MULTISPECIES: alginate O-acetyltransferase AlgF [unclassified Pseudomonas]MDH0896758.1 alginate O-acetyltransferase AlgF [Pseudomonas sp. GD03875]MDH1065935.1 alginate O-acetyltransferase AlgF [Pseudomonas sp. GD03985]
MTMQTTLRKLALGLGCLSLAATFNVAHADEGGLYGPTAPAGSAFVRAYNAGSSELDLSLGSVNIKDVQPRGSSDFSFLPAGSYSASAAGKSLPVNLKADQYYTLVRLPSGELNLVEDPAFKNRQKALVRVQNLSDTPVSLKTADGKTEVIPAVAGKARGDREINPVKVRLALFAGDQKVSDLNQLVLERGEVAALYVTGSGSNLSPVWVQRPAGAE